VNEFVWRESERAKKSAPPRPIVVEDSQSVKLQLLMWSVCGCESETEISPPCGDVEDVHEVNDELSKKRLHDETESLLLEKRVG
jgi:hypothetical protein